jgi:hypothetical protein
VPFLWTVGLRPSRPAELRAYKLVTGAYYELACRGAPAIVPGPVPVPLDLAMLTP